MSKGLPAITLITAFRNNPSTRFTQLSWLPFVNLFKQSGLIESQNSIDVEFAMISLSVRRSRRPSYLQATTGEGKIVSSSIPSFESILDLCGKYLLVVMLKDPTSSFSRPSSSLILSQPFPLQASLVALQSRQIFLNEQKSVIVGCGVGIYAVAGWLGSYRGKDSTHDMARSISAFGFILWHPSSKPSILSNRQDLFIGTIGIRPLCKLFKIQHESNLLPFPVTASKRSLKNALGSAMLAIRFGCTVTAARTG